MIKVIIVVVILFSIFLYSISLDVDQHKKESEEIEKIMQNKKQKKIEKVEKPKRISNEELLLTRALESFLKVFPSGKYVRNFIVKDFVTGRKTKIKLLLICSKGLFVVAARPLFKVTVYMWDEADDEFRCWKSHNGKQDTWSIKNPILNLNEQIEILENMPLKYKFYYDPIVVFTRETRIRKLDAATDDEIVQNILLLEQFFKKLDAEEEELFTEEKINYLHRYLMKKKFED